MTGERRAARENLVAEHVGRALRQMSVAARGSLPVYFDEVRVEDDAVTVNYNGNKYRIEVMEYISNGKDES